MNTKKCVKCLKNLSLTEFHLKLSNKDGISNICKVCKTSIQKESYIRNKDQYLSKRDKINSRRRTFRQNNIEAIRLKEQQLRLVKRDRISANAKKWRESNSVHFGEWRKANYKLNKERIQSARREKKLKNPLFKVSSNLRTRLWHALKLNKWFKVDKFTIYVGCTLEELRQYLESKFQPGMTWDNYGRYGWHIDHIKPLSIAVSEEELLKLNHYTNLQPLWAKDNIRKGNKYGT